MGLTLEFNDNQSKELILSAVKEEIKKIKDKEIELAKAKIEKEFNDIVSRLAMSIAQEFDCSNHGASIVIKVKK